MDKQRERQETVEIDYVQTRKQSRFDEMIERRDGRLVQAASTQIQHHNLVSSRIHQVVLQLLELVFDGLFGVLSDHVFS